MKRLERLHAMTEMLRRSGTRGCTAERLAREFSVSVRTIKRDVEALDRSGLAIWSRPGPHGGYGVIAQSPLPPVSLSAAEAVALLAAVAAAPDAPYSDAAAAAARRVTSVLDPVTRERAETLAGRVWVDHEPVSSRVVQSAVEHAMADQVVVRIRYTAGDGAVTTRDVEPVIFASTNGRWYLIGWCRLRGAMRWFLMTRIARATVTRSPCSGHSVEEIGSPPETATALGLRYE